MRFVHESKPDQNQRGGQKPLSRPDVPWGGGKSRLRIVRPVLTAGAAVLLLSGVLLNAPSVSSAELASIPISLIVQESCEIRSSATTQTLILPSVSCLHGAASAVMRGSVDPAQPLSTFESIAQVAHGAVLTVAF